MYADHQDLLHHSRVRLLSSGKAFEPVWELKTEIGAFLELMGKSDVFPELSDKNWQCGFAFAVADMYSHNALRRCNFKRKISLCTNVEVFKFTLALFSKKFSKISTRTLSHTSHADRAGRNANIASC